LSCEILNKIQARVGLIFHSAAEKSVFSIAFFNTLAFRVIEVSSLIVGIRGNSSASIHLIFMCPEIVFTSILASLVNSNSISSSLNKFT
jgi:hypothetical protein